MQEIICPVYIIYLTKLITNYWVNGDLQSTHEWMYQTYRVANKKDMSHLKIKEHHDITWSHVTDGEIIILQKVFKTHQDFNKTLNI